MKWKLKNGQIVENNEDLQGFSSIKLVEPESKNVAIAYKLNGKLYDMSAPLLEEGDLEYITPEHPDYFEILNHSCSHLMGQALMNLYPHAHLGFGPAIEEGFYYDIDLGDVVLKEEDLPKIEEEMRKCAKENFKFQRREVSKEEALEIFKNNPYKIELIEGIEDTISIYTQGNFTDLCTGVHVPSTGYLKNFKLLTIAGAYWRGDSDNKQLTRIYGVCKQTKEELEEWLKILEERKARDHRKLGKELGLFMISEYGPGFPFWLPNGMILKNNLTNWWTEYHLNHGYKQINTPIMLSRELWETSGHWEHYKDNMYTTKVDEKIFAVKPMNCPGSILVYKNDIHSYKDLPVRLAELGLVHRHEASGALNGLFRVRCFTQDDAHIFIRKDQLVSEIKSLIKLYDDIYSLFGLDYHIELSTRPDDYIGDIKVWNQSEKILEQACRKSGHPFKINPGDGAFYGPKLDFKLRDSMNRIWQCGTIQLDMNLPERFDCTYIDEKGEKQRPIMLHRAVLGSVERFIGIITENFGGAFPTWLSPVQVEVLPVNNEIHAKYAKKLVKKLEAKGIRAHLDDSNEKLGYRMRNAVVHKIPYVLVIGDKEVQNNEVTYRLYSSKDQISISTNDFIKKVLNDINKKLLPKDRN